MGRNNREVCLVEDLDLHRKMESRISDRCVVAAGHRIPYAPHSDTDLI